MSSLKEGSRKIGETMSANLHNSMKVGIVHFMAYPETMGGDGPAVETIKKIVQDDFSLELKLHLLTILKNVKRSPNFTIRWNECRIWCTTDSIKKQRKP